MNWQQCDNIHTISASLNQNKSQSEERNQMQSPKEPLAIISCLQEERGQNSLNIFLKYENHSLVKGQSSENISATQLSVLNLFIKDHKVGREGMKWNLGGIVGGGEYSQRTLYGILKEHTHIFIKTVLNKTYG